MSSEEWANGMFDEQLKMTERAMNKVSALRNENVRLQKQLQEVAPDMWAMREQITMLEMQLRDILPSAQRER